MNEKDQSIVIDMIFFFLKDSDVLRQLSIRKLMTGSPTTTAHAPSKISFVQINGGSCFLLNRFLLYFIKLDATGKSAVQSLDLIRD